MNYHSCNLFVYLCERIRFILISILLFFFDPVHGPFNGLFPTGIDFVSFLHAHCRFKDLVNLAVFFNVLKA